jgi:hypothetical protein
MFMRKKVVFPATKNGIRPVHPGEVLREDYLKPLQMSANALATALKVPASCVKYVDGLLAKIEKLAN